MERLTSRLSAIFFVALIAAASLGFELLQTRVLSALYYNNIVYMTVTIALLGLGISGVLVSLLHHRMKNAEQFATWCAVGLATSIMCCMYFASILPAVFPEFPAIYKMIISYFILVIPFLFSGSALSIMFMKHGKQIYGLYFADLFASALAAVLFSMLLWPLGANHFMQLCASASFIAFLIRASAVGINIHKVIIFSIAFICIAMKYSINNVPEKYKTGAPWVANVTPIASAWTTISKIDIFPHPNHLIVFQDNDANTLIHGQEERNTTIQLAKQGRPSQINVLAYYLRPHPENVLVIGVGGGVDVFEAYTYGARSIDGAEINPATIRLVTQKFGDYAQWPKWSNIHIHEAEGRHFVRNSNKKYDVIVMSAVDTFAALNSGAYVLSENYLYTVEAIKDYLNALKPNGVMTIYRWFFLQPRESLRLANLFVNAAETVGSGKPAQRILVIGKEIPNQGLWASTFIKREPFTANEIKMIADRIKHENYFWVYIPKVLGKEQQAFEQSKFANHDKEFLSARKAYSDLITADPEERAHFENNYQFKITPTYDDSPFFFEYYNNKGMHSLNWDDLRGSIVHYVLYILLILTTAFCIAGMGIPLLIFGRKGIQVKRMEGLIGFFSSLGIGFMFVEIGCMQWLNLYLGHPMYSLIIVLASLLLFAGVGSAIAGYLKISHLAKLRIGMFGSAILIICWLVAMKYLMVFSEHWSLFARIVIVLISLFPLGICMGIPFATGLNYLAQHQERFIPWAWGINGLTSVTSSILVIILAMKFGFTTVILLGSFIYAVGYFAFAYHIKALHNEFKTQKYEIMTERDLLQKPNLEL